MDQPLKTSPHISGRNFISLMRAKIEPVHEEIKDRGEILGWSDEETVTRFSRTLARHDYFDIFNEVYEDWKVVKVGFDDVFFGGAMAIARHTKLEGLLTLPFGLTFLAGRISASWEAPVFAIVYHNGTSFRGHIPMTGNTFNPRTMAAFGNHKDADVSAYLDLYTKPPRPRADQIEELAQDIFEGECPPIGIDEDGIEADLARNFVIV